ncbi:MAG: hypothetical protein WA906_08345, partial [Pacificimonas sp.]
MIEPKTPCLVGAAQVVGREDNPANGLSPADLIASAVRKAFDDAGVAAETELDALAVIRLFADSSGDAFASPFGKYENLPWSIAKRAGISARELIYGPVGGNTPQMLVNVLAQQVGDGELDIAMVAGGEALRTQAKAAKAGLDPD